MGPRSDETRDGDAAVPRVHVNWVNRVRGPDGTRACEETDIPASSNGI